MKREILMAKIIARFPEGDVYIYDGDYNEKDIDDLKNIASWIAKHIGGRVYILPRISSIKDPNYDCIFSGQKGLDTIGNAPTLK